MFWSAKPTIDADDLEWQLLAWRWLLDNLGGLATLRSYPTLRPCREDFPPTGLSGHAHVLSVFARVAAGARVDPASFRLEPQGAPVDPCVAPLAFVHNAPVDPLGTYRLDGNVHVISYDPVAAHNLEGLIATLIHEICHAVLFAIPEPPPGALDTEEFATDLATVFFGFGLFGGNQSFRFSQFRDDATGSQGWSIGRSGYLGQDEWGFALAVRMLLAGDPPDAVEAYACDGLRAHFRKNEKYLRKNPRVLDGLA